MYDSQDQPKSCEMHYADTNEISTFQNDESSSINNIYSELDLKKENFSPNLTSYDQLEAKNIYQEVISKNLRGKTKQN